MHIKKSTEREIIADSAARERALYDPEGSYTGVVPRDLSDQPTQDADDL